ncbi:hypothetical protein CHS0354_006571 [Potamilus streckersoni]|uniref:C1q domain-containing protein n=1 Tax=Potamilus streckersoni TaxID=2493646 RepID=A0AAE0TCS0_9BIVA|nr:hypothetical protein CHS0354_006571 [Potamilus streckersoni]
MKIFTVCLAFILCTFASGAQPPGIDSQRISIFDLTRLDVQNSLGISIGYVKSMLESMERKLLQTENHVRMLEDKVQTYERKYMLIEQESMSAKKSLKRLEDTFRESENVQSVQVRNLTRRLESMEHRLSHVDELEMKLHKAESRLSLVEELETKLKAVEQILVKINTESRDNEMKELSSLSEVNDHANIHSMIGNDHSDNQWYESPIDRNVTERKKVHTEQTKGLPFNRLRGLPLEDRVAFRVSGLTGHQPFHPGQRLTFASLDYNEGGGFHMSIGTFICPKTGTYFFVGTISSAGGGYVSTAIKIDGEVKIAQYSAYGHPGDNMSTGAAVTHCRAGDSVWMELTAGEYMGAWTTMSGFLLWADN